jgi:hypothetical protein
MIGGYSHVLASHSTSTNSSTATAAGGGGSAASSISSSHMKKKQKNDMNGAGEIQSFNRKGTSSKGKPSNGSSTNNSSSTTLVMLLRVLNALYESSNNEGIPSSSLISNRCIEGLVTTCFRSTSQNSVLILNARSRHVIAFERSKSMSLNRTASSSLREEKKAILPLTSKNIVEENNKDNGTHKMISRTSSKEAQMIDLSKRLTDLWKGLTLGNPSLATENILPLQEIARLVLKLSESVKTIYSESHDSHQHHYPHENSDIFGFKSLLSTLFCNFPHNSHEAALVRPGNTAIIFAK